MATVLDIIQEVFEEDLGPDLIIHVSDLSPARLYKFQERYSEFARAFHLPPKRGDHLRPFVTSTALHYAKQIYGFPLSDRDFDLPETAGLQEDTIKQHLLYCHSLAVLDPLPYFLDFFRPSQADKQARIRFRNYLIFLNQIRPLVEAGTIFFLDESYQDAYRRDFFPSRGPKQSFIWPPALADSEQVAVIAAEADLSEAFGEGEVRPLELRILYINNALESIATTLVASEFHNRNLDMYFPARFFREALRGVVTRVRENLQIREGELLLLERLLSVKVPNLADLDPQDLVRIREGEETFAKWRRAVGRALERIATLDPYLLDPAQEATRVMQEELAEEQRRLQDDVKKSRFLAMAQRGFRSFTIGALAAVGLSYFFDPAAAVARAGGAAVLDLLLSYLGGHGGVSERALWHHFLLFEPPGSGISSR